nr:hypothetical protein [Tanacetum cinerariifolium]
MLQWMVEVLQDELLLVVIVQVEMIQEKMLWCANAIFRRVDFVVLDFLSPLVSLRGAPEALGTYNLEDPEEEPIKEEPLEEPKEEGKLEESKEEADSDPLSNAHSRP